MNEKIIRDITREIIKHMTQSGSKDKKIPIEVSGRHVHLRREDVETLFGKGYILNNKKDLSQPGQYLCSERIRLIGPKGVLDNVAILGPTREKSQIEISRTDARYLGVNPPLRQSGLLSGSGSIYVASEKTAVKINEGVIIAKRHIHMTPEDAKYFDIQDKQLISVRIVSNRPVILEDVIVRVNKKYVLSMHIDFDEANASDFEEDVYGEIVG